MARVVFILLVLIGSVAFAEKVKAVRGAVANDGSSVYSQPDFDSPVIETLNRGAKLPVSTRQFIGAGGMGLFHKVKTPDGKLGYMPDTDVSLPKGTHIEAPKGAPPRKDISVDKVQKKKLETMENEHKPIYLTRYIGGTFEMVDYTENFPGVKLHSYTPFFGLRLTGPELVGKTPPLDFNFQFWPLAPSYLNQLGGHSGSGFLLMTDILLHMPLYSTERSLVFYGLGPLFTFSDYQVQVGGGNYNSQDLRLGLVMDIGYGYRFSHFIARFDVKAYLEKTFYFGEMLTFQTEY